MQCCSQGNLFLFNTQFWSTVVFHLTCTLPSHALAAAASGWTAPSMQAASCNADLQISKEILRNQCEKVTQQTWPDWGGRWRNWGVGVRGPQWPCEIFQMVSKWQNLKLIHDWIQFRWAFKCRIFFWLRNWSWKLKYHFFGGLFTRLTSQSQAGTLSRRHRMRNILLETSSHCYDCNKKSSLSKLMSFSWFKIGHPYSVLK